jgi:hypothetical protein
MACTGSVQYLCRPCHTAWEQQHATHHTAAQGHGCNQQSQKAWEALVKEKAPPRHLPQKCVLARLQMQPQVASQCRQYAPAHIPRCCPERKTHIPEHNQLRNGSRIIGEHSCVGCLATHNPDTMLPTLQRKLDTSRPISSAWCLQETSYTLPACKSCKAEPHMSVGSPTRLLC